MFFNSKPKINAFSQNIVLLGVGKKRMQSNEDIAQELDYLYNQSGHKAFGLNNNKLLKILFQKNLIERDGNYLALTGLAIEIQENHGGWINYLAKQEKEQILKSKRELELHEATISASESARGSHKEAIKSRISSYISVIFAGIAIVISIVQNKNENESIQKYKELNQRIDSLTKNQVKKQQEQKDSLIHTKHNTNQK